MVFSDSLRYLRETVGTSGYTTAHAQAAQGWVSEDPEILRLSTIEGWTVAHEQAALGWVTEDPELLALTDYREVSVSELIASYALAA